MVCAYKLRDASIESDRYFRQDFNQDFNENSNNPDVSCIKIERLECQPGAAVIEQSRPVHSRNLVEVRMPVPPEDSMVNEFNYTVDCYKKGSRSLAWRYFGRLIDDNGHIVSDKSEFMFCKICVCQRKTLKSRYKTSSISTTIIFQHLKVIHGIDLTPDNPPPLKAQPHSLSFECPEENCGKVYKLKMCLDIHLGLEHTGIADKEPECTDYNVMIYRRDSMASNYFGSLLDANFKVADNGFLYCRLCVGVGNLNSKYPKASANITLLHHLRYQHLTIVSKRKRFVELDASSMSSQKILKQERF